MDEYIKRESAIEAIMSDPPDAHYQSWYAEKIKAIPGADVATVVRCKDCKNRNEDSWCEYVDDDDNFYCARGKRKEGAGNDDAE